MAVSRLQSGDLISWENRWLKEEQRYMLVLSVEAMEAGYEDALCWYFYDGDQRRIYIPLSDSITNYCTIICRLDKFPALG